MSSRTCRSASRIFCRDGRVQRLSFQVRRRQARARSASLSSTSLAWYNTNYRKDIHAYIHAHEHAKQYCWCFVCNPLCLIHKSAHTHTTHTHTRTHTHTPQGVQARCCELSVVYHVLVRCSMLKITTYCTTLSSQQHAHTCKMQHM